MNRDQYDNLQIGMSVQEVIERSGNPVETRVLSNGNIEYIYVEKIFMGSQIQAENHYIIVISGDKVVSKRTESRQPPAFDAIYQNDPNFTQNY